mmetsp:Transcript_30330/g.59496  ORF Transcript_30330/g.59496 Transcript_30330/m.59496 type:complete len:586 (+) Transcript_30330:110-1867(+)
MPIQTYSALCGFAEGKVEAILPAGPASSSEAVPRCAKVDEIVWLQPLRRYSLALGGAALLFASVILVARAAAGPLVHSQLRRPCLQEKTEAAACDQVRVNVDYWTRMGLHPVSDIESAEACREECRENAACGAWTWGKQPGIWGVSSVCFLKRLGPNEKPMQISKVGVVSGFACRRSWDHSQTRNGCGFLDNVDLVAKRTIKITQGVSNAEICRATCRAAPGCSAFTWGKKQNGNALSGTCFLKALEQQKQPPHGVPKDGVVSGLACTSHDGGLAPGLLTDAFKGEAEDRSTTPSSTQATTSSAPPAPAPTTPLAKTTGPTAESQGSSIVASSTTGPSEVVHQRVFCFALMVPFTYEGGLLDWQFRKSSGLFACDEHMVYSNSSQDVAGVGFGINVINMDLECERGGEFQSQLNLKVFREVWARVESDGIYRQYDWTVKVDADAVFLPSRLQYVLQNYSHAPASLYFTNCRFGLHGAIEVFSRFAVQSLTSGWGHCEKHFAGLCAGPCWWGENLFVDQCLSEVLNVHRYLEDALLLEDKCGMPEEGWRSCSNPGKVAFHPFKSVDEYKRCLYNATSVPADTVLFK